MQDRRASWPKTSLKRLEVLILTMQQTYQSSSTISSDSPMEVIVPTEHPQQQGARHQADYSCPFGAPVSVILLALLPQRQQVARKGTQS